MWETQSYDSLRGCPIAGCFSWTLSVHVHRKVGHLCPPPLVLLLLPTEAPLPCLSPFPWNLQSCWPDQGTHSSDSAILCGARSRTLLKRPTESDPLPHLLACHYHTRSGYQSSSIWSLSPELQLELQILDQSESKPRNPMWSKTESQASILVVHSLSRGITTTEELNQT